MDKNMQVTIPVTPRIKICTEIYNIQVTTPVAPRIRKGTEIGDGQEYASDHPSYSSD